MSDPIVIAAPPCVMSAEDLEQVAIAHAQHRLQLIAPGRLEPFVRIGDSASAAVDEILVLARIGAGVCEVALRTPDRGLADAVNEVTRQLRKA